MTKQSEFFYPQIIVQPRRAEQSVIDSFKSYRDAVVWCWKNRVGKSGEKIDQAAFANYVGMHSPHMSRCVNPNSRAPMNLSPDFVQRFEMRTGWKAVTQYECKAREITPMEWVLEDQRRA